MRNIFAALIACSFIAFAAAEANAQVFASPVPQVVYRPALPIYSYPSVIVNRPLVVAAPAITQTPVVTHSPVITAGVPSVSHYPQTTTPPVVTQPAPAANVPAVVAQPAQVVTYAPITAAPILSARPVAAYRPALPLYRQPIVTYGAPVTTGDAVPVARPALISPKVYYPGQPIRNMLRAITP